eukprot:5337563-Pyramimonas_sp.AAC.1
MAGHTAPAGSPALLAGQPAEHTAPLPTAMPPPYARPEPPAVMPAADSQMLLMAEPAADTTPADSTAGLPGCLLMKRGSGAWKGPMRLAAGCGVTRYASAELTVWSVCAVAPVLCLSATCYRLY